MPRTVRTAAIVLAVLFIAACNTRTLLNVENTGLSVPPTATMKQVEDAIRAGATERGWGVRQLEPGKLLATVHIRTHMAAVTITHDTKMFSITYKDSDNLHYSGTGIHRNYNNWVRNLKTSILSHSSKIQ